MVVATQMLESMQKNPRPTRAEVADVTNAVLELADAVMLSGESANGKYPSESIAMQASICEHAEDWAFSRGLGEGGVGAAARLPAAAAVPRRAVREHARAQPAAGAARAPSRLPPRGVEPAGARSQQKVTVPL